MKKYLSIILIATLAILFTSCSKEESDSQDLLADIVGTWQAPYSSGDAHYTLTFSRPEGESTDRATYELLFDNGSYTTYFQNCYVAFKYKDTSNGIIYIYTSTHPYYQQTFEYQFQYIDYNNIQFDNKNFTRIK